MEPLPPLFDALQRKQPRPPSLKRISYVIKSPRNTYQLWTLTIELKWTQPLLRGVEKANTFTNRFSNYPYNLMFLNYFFNMDRIML